MLGEVVGGRVLEMVLGEGVGGRVLGEGWDLRLNYMVMLYIDIL